MTMNALKIILAVVLAMTSSLAYAKPALRDVAEIDGTVLAIGIADEIRKNCPTIEGRDGKAIRRLWALVRHARSLGYSDDEINAYRKSETEKARLRASGEAYLASHGARRGDMASYCAIGLREINTSSSIGGFLRVN